MANNRAPINLYGSSAAYDLYRYQDYNYGGSAAPEIQNPGLPEERLVAQAAAAGVPVQGLSSYCRACIPPESTLVLGFGGLRPEEIPAAAEALRQAFAR